MRYVDVIKHYGTEAEAGRAIDLERQTVHRWQKSGLIPLDQQVKYEVASGGKLRSDIPDELRARRKVAASRRSNSRLRT